jgi:hypothetical protein
MLLLSSFPRLNSAGREMPFHHKHDAISQTPMRISENSILLGTWVNKGKKRKNRSVGGALIVELATNVGEE